MSRRFCERDERHRRALTGAPRRRLSPGGAPGNPHHRARQSVHRDAQVIQRRAAVVSRPRGVRVRWRRGSRCVASRSRCVTGGGESPRMRRLAREPLDSSTKRALSPRRRAVLYSRSKTLMVEAAASSCEARMGEAPVRGVAEPRARRGVAATASSAPPMPSNGVEADPPPPPNGEPCLGAGDRARRCSRVGLGCIAGSGKSIGGGGSLCTPAGGAIIGVTTAGPAMAFHPGGSIGFARHS